MLINVAGRASGENEKRVWEQWGFDDLVIKWILSRFAGAACLKHGFPQVVTFYARV